MSDQQFYLGVAEGPSISSGQDFWLARSSYANDPREFSRGAPIKVREPQHLYAAMCEYFKYAQDNPLQTTKTTSTDGVPRVFAIETPRPLTKKAFMVFLGIRSKHYDEYAEDRHLGPVIEWFENIIFTQKFEGALSGEFNSNLIVRDLGLGDAMDLGIKGNGPLNVSLSTVPAGQYLTEEQASEKDAVDHVPDEEDGSQEPPGAGNVATDDDEDH